MSLESDLNEITDHYDNQRSEMQPKIAKLLAPEKKKKRKKKLKSLAELPDISGGENIP